MKSTNTIQLMAPGDYLLMVRPRGGMHRYTLLAVLLIAFVGLVTFVAPTDPDVWWHLRNGLLILESGIPTHDVYSWTAAGRPWLVQEWLTEVGMYALKEAAGYAALSLLFGVIQAVGGVLLYALVRARGGGRVLSLLLLMLYFVFATPTWGVRPQVLSAVFLGSFYLILTKYRANPSRSRLLWLLPPLTALWANLHASYFIGIALVGAFMVGEFANSRLYRTDGRGVPVRPLAVALTACAAATLLNPYFIELWTYPLTYVLHGTSNPLLRYTQEWQSPNFHEPGNLLFGLSLVLLALAGIARPTPGSEGAPSRVGFLYRVDVTDAIVTAAFALLALQAVRIVPLYGMIALPVLGGALSRLWPALSRVGEQLPSEVEGKVNLFAGAIVVVLAAYALIDAPGAQRNSEPREDTGFFYPGGAAAYIGGLKEPARMYNSFAWGGYLIYKLYPRQRVFIDGRADMYREGIFDDFITIQNTAPRWRELLQRYGVNLALTETGSPLDYALSHEAGWRVGFRDANSVVYQLSR